jgi:cardiolipin synthase
VVASPESGSYNLVAVMKSNKLKGYEKEPGSLYTHDRVLTLPNILTLARIALTVPFLILINRAWFGWALLIFFIASVTDFIDGYIARRFNQQSSFGRLIDPLADKLLTTASFIVMAIPNGNFPTIPIWLAVAVVGRDVVILLGSLVVYMLTRYKQFKPTALGKVNTFLELGLIVVFLAFNHFDFWQVLLPLCYAIVITSVVASGGEYIYQGVKIMKGGARGNTVGIS